jgi:hypothetical protein
VVCAPARCPNPIAPRLLKTSLAYTQARFAWAEAIRSAQDAEIAEVRDSTPDELRAVAGRRQAA